MRVRGWGTRIFWFFSVAGVTLLAALLISAAPSFGAGVAHDVPGTPMGLSGASGVVDVTTSPQDVYAVYLFAGKEVAFNASWENGYLYFGLYAPRTTTVVGATAVAFGAGGSDGVVENVITYTPAKSGVYYLGVICPTDNGVTYTVTVHGTETMPVRTATALSGPSRAKVNHVLTVSGTVSPGQTVGRVMVTKMHLVGKTWKRAGSSGVDVTGGTFSYSFTPKLTGKWHLVASYQGQTVGGSTYVSSKSSVKTVTVK